MTTLVFFLLVFLVVGVFFLFFHLMLGKMIRPAKPEADKLTVYECGEPTIGSAWIQFDLRYYVVALLFVIFDVEVAFFFPWAVVFGTANTLSMTAMPESDAERLQYNRLMMGIVVPNRENATQLALYSQEKPPFHPLSADDIASNRKAGQQLAWLAFWDILIFFGVLLVGFAYLWKRGDIDWVRSTAAERLEGAEPASALPDDKVLVGSGQHLGV
jgi:NADH-quinone oxidoreductase subunit A